MDRSTTIILCFLSFRGTAINETCASTMSPTRKIWGFTASTLYSFSVLWSGLEQYVYFVPFSALRSVLMYPIIVYFVFFTMQKISFFQSFKDATRVDQWQNGDGFHVGCIAFWREESVGCFEYPALCCRTRQCPRFERLLRYVSIEHSVYFLCTGYCVVESGSSVTDQSDALSKVACLWIFSGSFVLLITMSCTYWVAYFIFSVMGGRFLPESIPWIENMASSAAWSWSSICINLKVVGPSKRSILYLVCQRGSYVMSVLCLCLYERSTYFC